MRVLGQGGAEREVPCGQCGGEQGKHTGEDHEREQDG